MRLSVLLTAFLVAASAYAQIPEIPGYKATVLPNNLPLPVLVSGEGQSEQDVPVVLFIPQPGAGVIEGTLPATSLPGAPAVNGEFRLRTLPVTNRTKISLRDGRAMPVEIPMFAYVPAVADAEVVVAPAESAQAEVRATVSAPATRAVPAAPAPLVRPETRSLPPPLLATTAPVPPREAPIAPPSPAVEAPTITPAPVTQLALATWDEILSQSDFSNAMSVGSIVVDDRQLLRSRLPITAEFIQRPLSEVLLQLSALSGIDFSIGSLPSGDPTVTTRFHASPFAALEQISKQFGVGIYREPGEPLYVLRRVDAESMFAREYQLSHIHLGKSSGAAANETFGSGFGDSQSGNSGSSGSSNGGRRGRSSGSGSSRSTSSSGSLSGSTAGSGLNGTGGSDTFEDRFEQGSDVLFTLKSILGIAEQAPVVSQLPGAAEGEGGRVAAPLSTRPAATGARTVNGIVSYNADANSVFVLSTEQQHQWVKEYLRLVDRPTVSIAIDAMFVESDSSPSKKVGVDWSSAAVNWNVGLGNNTNGSSSSSNSSTGTGSTLTWGTLSHPILPSGMLINSDSFNAKISAFLTESKSRVARYPRVVTSNNREVRIATTSNIPIITSASTVAGAVSANTGNNNNSGTIQTNYDSGTQEIGTIITLLPSRITNDLIHVKISIEISSGESRTQGEGLTGRIPTTSTVYEGEVDIPVGKTLSIGGLERIAETAAIGRIPGISRIPVFGFLFKNKQTDFSNTNISLFITPRLIDSAGLTEGSPRQDRGNARALRNSAELESRADKENK